MRRKIRSQEKSVQSQIANALTPFPRLWFNARFRWFLIIVLRTRLRPGADVAVDERHGRSGVLGIEGCHLIVSRSHVLSVAASDNNARRHSPPQPPAPSSCPRSTDGKILVSLLGFLPSL